MYSKHLINDNKSRHIAGNSTRIDPQQDITSYYHGYAVTAFNKDVDGIPKTPENKVVYSKYFVDENHK